MNVYGYFEPNYEFADKQELINKVNALVVASELTSAEIETVDRAWQDGMMESGDTPSKSARADLLAKGILCQTCWENNNYTFSVSYPFGYQVMRALTFLESVKL